MSDLLQFFDYAHLPPHLQTVSKSFHDLAHELAMTLPLNAETTTALRKLLEAKDCAVRSLLFRRPEPSRFAKAVEPPAWTDPSVPFKGS
jgi:hypothetical protein